MLSGFSLGFLTCWIIDLFLYSPYRKRWAYKMELDSGVTLHIDRGSYLMYCIKLKNFITLKDIVRVYDTKTKSYFDVKFIEIEVVRKRKWWEVI